MYISKTLYRQNRYSRLAATKYAITYALKPNPKYRYFPLVDDKGGDCANFLSQCLFAGGAPMDFNTARPWWYKSYNGNIMKDTWSISWAVAHSLYYYLKVSESINSPGVKGLEVYNKKDLELGDLIFFENNKGTIFHSAIITSFLGREPLISQHSFEALNIPYRSSWTPSKFHFIKVII
nr:amidase domain-containing protein [Clostridium simiarum]